MSVIVENPIPEFLFKYCRFVECYNNPDIAAKDIENKLELNHNQYLKLRKEAIKNDDINEVRHRNYENSKYYRKNNKTGYFEIVKKINNETIYISSFESEEIAQKIVKKCIEHQWNITEIESIIEANKVKSKYYTYRDGFYNIQRKVNGKMTYFCRFQDKKITKEVIKKLEEHEWDKQKLPIIFKELCINVKV